MTTASGCRKLQCDGILQSLLPACIYWCGCYCDNHLKKVWWMEEMKLYDPSPEIATRPTAHGEPKCWRWLTIYLSGLKLAEDPRVNLSRYFILSFIQVGRGKMYQISSMTHELQPMGILHIIVEYSKLRFLIPNQHALKSLPRGFCENLWQTSANS